MQVLNCRAAVLTSASCNLELYSRNQELLSRHDVTSSTSVPRRQQERPACSAATCMYGWMHIVSDGRGKRGLHCIALHGVGCMSSCTSMRWLACCSYYCSLELGFLRVSECLRTDVDAVISDGRQGFDSWAVFQRSAVRRGQGILGRSHAKQGDF